MLEPAYRAALEGRESAFELPHGERDHLHRVVPVRDRAGAIVGGMLVAQDITDRKTREHRLKHWASRDGLTGLWNRDRLVQELDRALVEGRRSDDRAASLLFVDLDGFKAINDALGHSAGDDLLRAVGRELEGHVRFTDTVARVGGDEFAVLLTGGHDEASIAIVCDRIVDSFTTPVYYGDSDISTTVSVGAAAFPQHGKSEDELYKSADLALYDAKRLGRNNWRWYSTEPHEGRLNGNSVVASADRPSTN